MKFKEMFGPWALVTGASSGIGEEFARQLAAKGLNLTLAARREDKMKALGERLAGEHGIAYRTIRVDLSGEGFLDRIEESTHDLDIGLVVSNAGSGMPGSFLELPVEDLSAMLKLNVMTHMELSHHFGARMAGGNREGGGLLLVSSMAAFQGVPYMANYSGAKGYVLNLGEALNHELKDKGINVSVLVPGPTETPMMNTPGMNMDKMPMPFMSTEQVVREGLAALLKNKPHHVPGTMNRAMSGFFGRRLLNRNANVAMWGMMMKKAVTPDKV